MKVKKLFNKLGNLIRRPGDGSHLVDAASAANAHKKGTCPSFAAVDAIVRLLDQFSYSFFS